MTWKGDHPPKHVHVFKDDKLLVKWDFENEVALKGEMTSHIERIINELVSEGRL